MSSVHHTLCRLPRHIPHCVEELIEKAYHLFKNYSPQKLESASKKFLRGRWDKWRQLRPQQLQQQRQQRKRLTKPPTTSLLNCLSSSSVKVHDKFVKDLANQRPDEVLRQQQRALALLPRNQTAEGENRSSSGMFVKLAFWALSAGVGTMAFFVATTAKKWMWTSARSCLTQPTVK